MDNWNLIQKPIATRCFGRTGIQMPLLSIGGMRFNQSWEDLSEEKIVNDSQNELENILEKASKYGLNHIETARHYGTSERQLGLAFPIVPSSNRFIQTKIPPNNDPNEFEKELEISCQRLNCKKIDLLSVHGINIPEHLDQTLRPGGCLEVLKRWQKEDRIGSIGFSTHASTDLIIEAIESNAFDYVNLHWYFIKQDNSAALQAAEEFELGVFIISPTDKGGHLHTPSNKLLELCDPLHPIVFNDLFCLRDTRVHTISVGVSSCDDLDLHFQALDLLDKSNYYVPLIEKRLQAAAISALGQKWMRTWHLGLPPWYQTPGKINIPILLWLHNLVEAWDMQGYAKDRYGLLGKAGHWFPGENADKLDVEISEDSLLGCLPDSPWSNQIPEILRQLKSKVGGFAGKRLWNG